MLALNITNRNIQNKSGAIQIKCYTSSVVCDDDDDDYDDADILGEKLHTARPHTDTLLATSKKTGLELNPERTNCNFGVMRFEGGTK